MRAEKQGYFTLEEWRQGLKSLRSDTVNKLIKALPDLEKEVKRPPNFVDFYNYAFRYCLTEEKQKSIDIESICQLLDLVLGSHFQAQVDYFNEYLKFQSDYKVINMDQWMGFYRFCNEISFPDFSSGEIHFLFPGTWEMIIETTPIELPYSACHWDIYRSGNSPSERESIASAISQAAIPMDSSEMGYRIFTLLPSYEARLFANPRKIVNVSIAGVRNVSIITCFWRHACHRSRKLGPCHELRRQYEARVCSFELWLIQELGIFVIPSIRLDKFTKF
ncbi:DEFECTIVE IN CULLIN NEDDYLATION PROTEIN [Salix purpurea]|uniref:Defective in cullin neddylation protein n=1 Tax=Salix purpurea TaxID=77065 RepID=A0A9Q0QE99_SALPP|nr:DEFECTIVE IN CULLIN NEDDYLATION PROTEIN [Salix purpurea]